MVLACASTRLVGIATSDRPRDDFRAAIAQLALDFRKESIVANHHADLAEARVEERVLRLIQSHTYFSSHSISCLRNNARNSS